MSDLSKDAIDALLDRVRAWPAGRQEDAARVLLAMEAEPLGVYRLSDEERADVEAALAEVEQGEVATDPEVVALFARFRP